MFKSIVFTALMVVGSINAQLAFHTDANTNSFQYQTPSSQTTFTRYFGGQAGTLLDGAEARQQQQVLPAPQNFAGYNYAPAASPSAPEQFEQLAQQYQQPQQNDALTQQQAQPQFTAQDIAAYFSQQQQAQQQQYAAPQLAQQQQYAAPQLQQQQYAAPQQQYAAPQLQQYGAPQQYSQLELQQAGSQQVAQTAQAPQTLGIQFSPSNEVSNVKFSSGGLNYNF